MSIACRKDSVLEIGAFIFMVTYIKKVMDLN